MPARISSRPDAMYLAAARRSMIGTAIVVFAAWIEFRLSLTLATSELLELVTVLAIAIRYGFIQASVASVMACLCLDFFFTRPVFSLWVSNPEDWTALGVFELAALLVSHLSTRAREQTERALKREAELERLYNLSRELLPVTRYGGPVSVLLASMQRSFSLDGAALFDAVEGSSERVGSEAANLAEEAKAAYIADSDRTDAENGLHVCVIRAGAQRSGALALLRTGLESGTAHALSSLAGVVLEASRALARETRAEAERQSEQLRTAVLDALAHEYKTPLTVIRSASTGLMEMGNLSEVQSELVELMDREVEQLSSLTSRLLQMARLERTDLRIRTERVDAGELVIELAADVRKRLDGHQLRVETADSDVAVCGDRQLIGTALRQYVDNALKYATPGSEITLSCEATGEDVRFAVHNVGSSIRPEERAVIFQRFYRSSDVRYRANGSGLGLSITKRIADLHRGKAWVTSDGVNGTTFYLALARLKDN